MLRRILLAYLSLTRGERNGFFVLAIIVVILILGRMFIPLILRDPIPDFMEAEEDFRAFRNIDFTVGLGIINRLSFKGDSGLGTWEGYPSHLLDIAMIDIDDDFSGKIKSDTYDIRLSLGMTPGKHKKLSLGMNLAYIS